MRFIQILVTAGLLLAISFFSSGPSALVRADEVYTFVVKKQEEKAKSRWSLAEWLDTRDRMRMMDLWLALHSSSPFEFYLGGAWEFAKTDAGQNYQGGIGYFAAFASIVGLEFQREQSYAQIWNGLFKLRLFGRHAQATNLTLEGGLRGRGALFQGMRSPVAGASITLYLAKFFGIDGLYRVLFRSSADNDSTTIKGSRFEGGAFIDFSFLRLYGGYFQEQETASLGYRQAAFPTRSGAQAGLRFYF